MGDMLSEVKLTVCWGIITGRFIKTIKNFFVLLDIVQFVPYRDAHSWMASTVGPGYANAAPSPGIVPPQLQGSNWAVANDSTHKLAQVKLAQEVLAEIPDQLTSYMKSRGIFPGKIHSASSKSKIVNM